MKKILLIGLTSFLVACGTTAAPQPTPEATTEVKEETPAPTEEANTSEEKTLIVYFSRAGENYGVGNVEKGNTQKVAEIMQEETGYDIFRIETVKEYPISYDETLEVATEERNNNERPELKTSIDNFDSYSKIILGYPIWWGDMPMAIYSFLESYNFNGKTIYPFVTHGSSGLAGTIQSIQETVSNATVKEGLAIQGTTAQNNAEETRKLVQDYFTKNNLGTNKTSATTGFDFETKTVLLNSGYNIPILGVGCFSLSDQQAENPVYWALKDGYRLIDTAKIYGNEPGVGRAIQRAIDEGICTREEIFVTTKMWTTDFSNGDEAINESLRKLNLDYIDLMILHHSQPSNDVEAYQAMERAAEEGKLKSIGLSNYYEPEDFDRLVNATTIKPALLQNETHPYHQSKTMKEHIAQYGTVMESWFPLGGRGNTQVLFNDETIKGIAEAHGKTSAQVILRWHLQAANIAIPGSSNEAHIQENYEIFDFELSDEEMNALTNIDKNQRFANY